MRNLDTVRPTSATWRAGAAGAEASIKAAERLAVPLAATGGLLVLPAFLASVAFPLATYTTALALFGLAHVVSELRYVDYRFGSRLRGGIALWVFGPLLAAVAVRLAGNFGALPAFVAVTLEVTLGAVMASAAFLCMRRRRMLGALVAFALALGAVLAPIQTLLILALAHNLTPIAFLADALDGAQRRRVLALMSVPFLILPLLIATGLPYEMLARVGAVDPDATLLDGGSLAANLGAYVPASLIETDFALHMFAAAVFAQCMHYAAVIVLLPRLIDNGRERRRTIVPWPSAMRFALGLSAAAFAFAVGFSIDFAEARKVYALAALVHAWLEIPVLMLALDGWRDGQASSTA